MSWIVDLVEQKAAFIKVAGRATEVINAGGLKFMASEFERVALESLMWNS